MTQSPSLSSGVPSISTTLCSDGVSDRCSRSLSTCPASSANTTCTSASATMNATSDDIVDG